ncbi:hypothetical protein L484_005282 [Morus notabilis]|uniref:Uncharacterized protein n=1 Tax=Morus notabilis TaxID=981085 RepID=W9QWW9_9ROSA|nr:hypothetical protein L484_005282 [Morus notabilis]
MTTLLPNRPWSCLRSPTEAKTHYFSVRPISWASRTPFPHRRWIARVGSLAADLGSLEVDRVRI